MSGYEVLVIGGGMAGVSIAAELAAGGTVGLLEMEDRLAYHTTGRSAATFLETYGGDQVRALTTGSRAFLEAPPEGFEPKLLTPRPLLQFVKQGRGDVLRGLHREVLPLVPDASLLDADEVVRAYPVLRPGYAEVGMLEPGAMEIDVMAVHQGYLKQLRARGGEVHKQSKVVSLRRQGSGWQVSTADGSSYSADLVVNAAGAWGDVVAQLAGLSPVGLVPALRSIFMVNSPDPELTQGLPLFGDTEQSFYIKPEGLQFLCSPADETPSEPKDAAPDQLEIARAIDEINAATTLGVRSVNTTWGGLRTFAPDHNFVMGLDPQSDTFMWFVGQGGYGIQTAPAAARLGAALAQGRPAPQDLVDRGLDVARLSPGRVMLSDAGH